MSDTITDRFGRVFTVSVAGGEATYTAQDGSISAGLPESRPIEELLATLEAMAPPQPPAPPPAPVVPDTVSNFQARAVLMRFPGSPGPTLFDDVNAWVKAQGGVAWQAWEYGSEVRRDSPMIAAAAAQFGLSGAQLDAMFITAVTISA